MAKITWQAGNPGIPVALLNYPMAGWRSSRHWEKCKSAVVRTLRADPLASQSLGQGLLGPGWKAGQPQSNKSLRS